MKFVILVKQEGEGCDYTIGCGYLYRFFDAKDMEDALYRVRTMEREDHNDNLVFGHRASDLKQAIIVRVDDMVDALHTKSQREIAEDEERAKAAKEEERQERDAAAKEQEAKDRAEYERLKRKFEGEN